MVLIGLQLHKDAKLKSNGYTVIEFNEDRKS